ncbi:MAG: HEAT repeat domain-containing protein [Chloroflexota bacterium]|nr:HEAT repeat domain-containing protein [Chloroflexota bacterium]
MMISRLRAAIKAQDDELAEKLVHRLTAEDEDELIQLAAKGETDCCWWAVRALALVGSGKAVDVISRKLTDEDSALRSAGALTLAHLYERAPEAARPAIPALAAMLTDSDGLVRQTAADALARCGDDAVDALGAVLDTLHDGARARAAYALRKIGTKKAAGLLYPLLDDPNHLVRSYAYDGLDDMGLAQDTVIAP